MVLIALLALVAETDQGKWIRVKNQDTTQVQGHEIAPWQSFAEISKLGDSASGHSAADRGPLLSIPLAQLRVPLVKAPMQSLGLGLSYPSHQQEVKADATVYFDKRAEPTKLDASIPFRPCLDFEAEVSLLLHRQEPHLFGYLIHNDLTDRALQLSTYNQQDMAPGFSESKSFRGANAHGPLLAIGPAELWGELKVELFVNGVLRQSVNPSENILSPAQIHRHVFETTGLAQGFDWVIIGTGTPAGTIFQAPTFWQKIGLFVRAGFNTKKAQRMWLDKFQFLKTGDVLEFRSKILGTASATVGQERG